jgi:hypothetical protein
MAWTEITRVDYDRRSLGYTSDCRDEEWMVIEPFWFLRARLAGLVNMQAVSLNAIQYSQSHII